MTPTSPRDRFLQQLATALQEGDFIKLTLGQPVPTPGAEAAVRRLLIRPVLLKGEKQCSIVTRLATRDETRNLPPAALLKEVTRRLGKEFLSAHLWRESGEVTLDLAQKRRPLRIAPGLHAPATLEHDRTKARHLDRSAPYLAALGVTDARGEVRERMGDKFRQIERFVDLLGSAWRESPLATRPNTGETPPITLCDMGSGKGYLTFAACDYLSRIAGQRVEAVGIEQRADLVTLCNQVAQHCRMEGQLRFVDQPIAQREERPLDLLLALHACNTATDDALASGVRSGASILLVAPCCHQEVRPQVDAAGQNPAHPLHDLLRHGLFAERHAEMATDALRTLLLEAAGYKVRVVEFVAAEHTAKNVMLIATRRKNRLSPAQREQLDTRIAALKTFYGITQLHLERLLQNA